MILACGVAISFGAAVAMTASHMTRRVAIVQSNYIPWKGYFDLIDSADLFVLFDDVQYTRRDWRNRNRIKAPRDSHRNREPLRAALRPCVVDHRGATYLYYTGWTLGRTVPFYFYVGAAVREREGGAFRRVSPAPILERSTVDPYLTASPSVLVDAGVWRMWYVSGTGWRDVGGAVQHRYHIKYAESADGLAWTRARAGCRSTSPATRNTRSPARRW